MSSITVNGSIERKGFGPGTWALVSEPPLVLCLSVCHAVFLNV